MAKFFKPRRGNLAMATSLLKGENKLKAGEIFFECPDSGIGKGTGKLKMGDGVSDYEDLPYFVDQKDIDVSTSAIEFEESSSTAYDTLLSEIVTGNALSTIIGAEKKMLRKFYADVTQLSNDNVENTRKINDCEDAINNIHVDLSKIDRILEILDVSSGMLVLDFGTIAS